MNKQGMIRFHLWWLGVVVVLLSVAELSEAGIFRRCRPRRCRPLVCRPVCPPAYQTVTATKEGECDPGYICCEYVYAEYWIDEECFATYYAQRCGNPVEHIYYDAACDSCMLECNCNDCTDCFNGMNFPTIPLPPDMPKDSLPRRFLNPALMLSGLSGQVDTVEAGPGHVFERDEESRKRGVVLPMPLEFDEQHKPNEEGPKRMVHLDWIKPISPPKTASAGTGYETNEKPHGHAEILWMDKVGEYVYSLKVRCRGQLRHYVVVMIAESNDQK